MKFHVLALLGLSIAGCACSAQTFQRDYVPTGVLRPDEEEIVLRLVETAGIKRVSQIRTYYIHPSSFIGILVKEEDHIENGMVTYRTANVSKEGWEPTREEGETDKRREGAFTLDRVWENVLTLFEIGAETYRVRVGPGVDREIADQILRCVGAGRVKFQSQVGAEVQRSFAPANVRRIYASAEQRESLSLTCEVSENWWFFATVRIVGDTLIVSQVEEVQS